MELPGVEASRCAARRRPSVPTGRAGRPGDAARVDGAAGGGGGQPRRAPARLRPNLTGPDAIVEAITEWTRRDGDVPAMADWDPVRARRLGQTWRIAHYRDGDWPSARSVAHHPGSLRPPSPRPGWSRVRAPARPSSGRRPAG